MVKNKQKKIESGSPRNKKIGPTIILLVQLSTWIFFDGAELGVMFGPQFCGSLRKKFVSSSLLAGGFWPLPGLESLGQSVP